MGLSMNDQISANRDSGGRAREVLLLAAWFGLLTGLLEGIIRTLLQSFGGVSWDMLVAGTSLKIIWVTPCFYWVIFLLAGAVLALAGRLMTWLPVAKVAVYCFGVLSFESLLSISGRMSRMGVAMLSLGLAAVLLRFYNARSSSMLLFCKRTLVWAAAASLLAFGWVESSIRIRESRGTSALPAAAAGAPNVLLIVVDTLRADHLSLLGYERKTSPNLEQIARESVFFENAVTTAPWTLPSHASMLTGLYPSECRVSKFGLAEQYVTLAEVLQARGYRTGAFSANTLFFTTAFGFGQGFIRFEDSFHSLHDSISRTILGETLQRRVLRYAGFEDLPGRKNAASVNDSLLRWLDGQSGRPFFAVLNYFDVHDPYLPPQPYRSRFSDRPNPGGVFNSNLSGRDAWDVSTPAILKDEIAAYDGSIAYVDDQIKNLFSELDQQGLLQNTIVLITSDHGEMFGEHHDFQHAHSMWAPLLYVPLLIRWPGKLPAGVKYDTPVSLTSLPATVMSLVTGGDARPFPGPSLAAFWTPAERPENWPESWAELPACPERRRPDFACFDGSQQAIVTANWYFIYHEKRAPQLFDAKADRAQLHNLAETPEGKKVVADFLARVSEKRR